MREISESGKIPLERMVGRIVGDIQRRDRASLRGRETKGRCATASGQLFADINNLLEKSGHFEKVQVGIDKPIFFFLGASRIKYRDILVTPPVSLGKNSVWVKESYGLSDRMPDEYIILLRIDSGRERTLFRVKRGTMTVNWYGEEATEEEIGLARDIIRQLGERLPEVDVGG